MSTPYDEQKAIFQNTLHEAQTAMATLKEDPEKKEQNAGVLQNGNQPSGDRPEKTLAKVPSFPLSTGNP